MEHLQIKSLYTLEETIAKEIFDGFEFPWEVLPKIGDFIIKLGNTLPEDKYEKRGENIWIAKSDNKIRLDNMYESYNIRPELLKSRQFYNNAFDTSVNYEDLMALKKELMR